MRCLRKNRIISPIRVYVSLDYLVGIDKMNTFSAKHLSTEQTELLELMLHEFHSDITYSGMLTQEQILLLQKMIHYFVSK